MSHKTVSVAIANSNDDCRSERHRDPSKGGKALTISLASMISVSLGATAFQAARADVSSSTGGMAADIDRGTIAEIVVTAQKRTENIQDVPMSITALSGDALFRSQSTRFEDYVGKVPGLTFIDTGGGSAGGSQLVIRGISSGGTGALGSSVATYIDETPYTAEGPFSGAATLSPNLDTFDMNRIEVLKGPQGTLYGANALGGLLKYVTNAPDPSAFATTVAVGGSSVDHGGNGSELHAMVNIPLSTDAALRVVGYDNFFPGYIDDPSRRLTDINGRRFAGGRASFLFEPSDKFSVRLSALYQNRTWSDQPNEDVNPGSLTPIHGNLIQETLIGQPGYARTQLYNATINGDLDFAKLISTTSYLDNKSHFDTDYSGQFGPLLTSIFGAPYGAAIIAGDHLRSITQELRLASNGTGALDWQVGGYFSNERGDEPQTVFPVDVPTKTILSPDPFDLGGFRFNTTYREYAGFGNIDYHFTPTFDVAVGGRYSTNKQMFHELAAGNLAGNQDFGVDSSQSVFTYSGDLRWHCTPQDMLYARVASGFVPGGPNDVILAVANTPRTYGSSKTVNYEVGYKGRALEDRMTFEVSVFNIDWRDIQVKTRVNGEGVLTNGGTARSYGVEWNLGYVPIHGLALDFNGTYNNAHLTEDTPQSVGGVAGNRLPSSALWQSSASAQYERSLFGNYSGFGGVDWRFTGKRYADFTAGSPRQQMPSFNIFDLRAGFESLRWSFTLYLKNVTNKVAINYLISETPANGSGPQSATIYTPRTVGATVTANF